MPVLCNARKTNCDRRTHLRVHMLYSRIYPYICINIRNFFHSSNETTINSQCQKHQCSMLKCGNSTKKILNLRITSAITRIAHKQIVCRFLHYFGTFSFKYALKCLLMRTCIHALAYTTYAYECHIGHY